MSADPVTILLVDDDEVDAMAVKRSLRELGIATPLVEARDGVEALDRLRGANGHEAVRPPCLVVLDLHMPRMGGIEFLTALRADPALRRTLVFVMTTAATAADRRQAYDRNIAGYIVKHPPGEAFRAAIAMLHRYCCVVAFPD